MKNQLRGTLLLLMSVMAVPLLTGQPSRIELKTHFSSTLGQSKQFNVLYPEGYDSESDHYPVVYLFRGAVNEWVDPTQDGNRRGNIKTVVDSLYARARIGKMLIIMPGLGAPASQSEYEYLVSDLFPYIDANFRTIPDRWHRSIDGFSLGGTVVTNLLAAVPHLFASVGSYDGTLNAPYFDNTKFSAASPSLIYTIKQVQLLYHTASSGGNNHTNNMAVFSILNVKGIYNALPSYGLDPNAQHNWYYADWHTAVTLPLHWNKMQSASNAAGLKLKTMLAGQTVNGTVPLEWTRLPIPNAMTTHLFYSSDRGARWTKAYSTSSSDSVWSWNTVPVKDGTRYQVKMITAGDSVFGSAISGTFTVNNPGNGAPDAEFTGLAPRDTISGNYPLQWFAADADGDAVSITVDISYNGGSAWTTLAASVSNSGSYLLNTRSLANSSSVLFRLTASDGSLTTSVSSPPLVLYNPRVNLLNAQFTHLSGTSDARFAAVGMHKDSLNSANYTITIQEVNGTKRYSVINSKGVEVVKNAGELDGRTEGPLFDGFRLLVEDFPVPTVDPVQTRWTVGSSPLNGDVKLIDVITESGTVTARPYPADYEIRIGNAVMDTSIAMFGAAAQPVPFTVRNISRNRKTAFIFVEIDGNGFLSRNDELYLVEFDSLHAPILTWHLQLSGNETDAAPAAGDVFTVRILKPLTTADMYQFIYYPPLSADNVIANPAVFSLSQNFPNPFNPSTRITFTLPGTTARNGNGRTLLSIYNVLGQIVATPVDGQLQPGRHSIEWNAGRLSSGVYFYRLTSGQFTETRKMLLTK